MDLVILGVCVLCVVLGAMRGLFRSLAELVAVILALFVAAQAANFGADVAVKQFLRPAADAAIEQRVEEMMSENITSTTPLEEMERVVDAIPNDFLRTAARELLTTMGLSTQRMPSYSARDVLLGLAEQVLDNVVEGMARNLAYSVIFLVSFAVVSIALRLVIRVLDLPFRLPVLRELNGFGGLLFGAVKAVVLVWIGLWFLFHARLLITPQVLSESFLLKRVVEAFASLGFPVIPG